MNQKPHAFVIMPFDEEFNSIYEKLIREPLVEAGYTVTRADSFLDQENILRSVIRGITTTDVLIADLTTNNPNVFYELGVAHGLGIPTVLIAQSISDVPFDLRSYRIYIYDTHFNQIEKLKSFFTKLAAQHQRGELSFANPVTDFANLTDYVSQGDRPHAAAETSQEASFAQESVEVDPKELSDFIVDGERAANDLATILAKLLKDNQSLTNRISRHTSNIGALNNDPTAGSARKFHKLFLLAASDINMFSSKVEGQMPLFEDAIGRVNENYSGFIELVDPSVAEYRNGLIQLRGHIQQLADNTTSAKEGMRSFRKASLELADRKLSKDLSRASRRLADALNGVIANIDRVDAFSIRALGMIEQKLGES